MVENRGSMWQGQYDKKLSLGDGIHIIGERDFDEDEEEKKEIEDL